MQPADPIEAIDPAPPMDAIDAIDAIDPIDPIERTENAEPIDAIDRWDFMSPRPGDRRLTRGERSLRTWGQRCTAPRWVWMSGIPAGVDEWSDFDAPTDVVRTVDWLIGAGFEVEQRSTATTRTGISCCVCVAGRACEPCPRPGPVGVGNRAGARGWPTAPPSAARSSAARSPAAAFGDGSTGVTITVCDGERQIPVGPVPVGSRSKPRFSRCTPTANASIAISGTERCAPGCSIDLARSEPASAQPGPNRQTPHREGRIRPLVVREP